MLESANTLACGFTWDDQWLILDNERIGDWSYIKELFFHKTFWRPIKRSSFVVDWHIWGPHGYLNGTDKANAAGFHASNILFETLACVALFAFLRKLGCGRRLATVAALLFAVHPLHTEAIANISHRKEPLSLFFYCLAFITYLVARNGFGPGRSREILPAGERPPVDRAWVTGWAVILLGGLVSAVSVGAGIPGGVLYVTVAVAIGLWKFVSPEIKGAVPFDGDMGVEPVRRGDVEPITTSYARSVFFLVLTLFFFLCGLLSKEVGAIMFPFTLLVYELAVAPGSGRKRRVWSALLLAGSLPVLALFFYNAPSAVKTRFSEEQIRWITGEATGSYLVVLAGAFKAWATYIWLLVWPSPLYLDRAFPLPPETGWVLAGVVLVALWAAGLVLAWRRSRLAFFALAWYGLNFLPISNVIPLTHWLVAERFAYVPSVGASLLVALFLEQLWERRVRFVEPGIQPPIAYVLATLLIVVHGAMTWQQNMIWKNSRTLWEHTLLYNKQSFRGLYGVGLEDANAGDVVNAEKLYREAIAVRDSYPEPHYALALLELNSHRYKEAIADGEVHAKLALKDPEPYMVIGNAWFGLRDYAAAAAAYRKALERKPTHIDARYNLANALYGARQYPEALGEVEQVITQHPSLDNFMLRGNIQEALQSFDDALDSYNQAASMGSSPEPYAAAGLLLLRMGRIDEARDFLKRSLALDPNQPRVTKALGSIPQQ